MQAQLTFLEEADPDTELRAELKKTKEQLTNLRRGLFGRYDKMVNELTALQEQMQLVNDKLEINNGNERKVLDFPV